MDFVISSAIYYAFDLGLTLDDDTYQQIALPRPYSFTTMAG